MLEELVVTPEQVKINRHIYDEILNGSPTYFDQAIKDYGAKSSRVLSDEGALSSDAVKDFFAVSEENA